MHLFASNVMYRLKNHSKPSKKSKNRKSKDFWLWQILLTSSIPKIMFKASKLREHNGKNFFTIFENFENMGQFLAQNAEIQVRKSGKSTIFSKNH